jgi:hypothetical protein
MFKSGVTKQLFVLAVFVLAIFPSSVSAKTSAPKDTLLERMLINPLASLFEPLFDHQPALKITYNINRVEKVGEPQVLGTSTSSGQTPLIITNSGMSKDEILSYINSSLTNVSSPTIQNITNTYVRGGGTEGLANTSGKSLADLEAMINGMSGTVNTSVLTVSSSASVTGTFTVASSSGVNLLSVSDGGTSTSSASVVIKGDKFYDYTNLASGGKTGQIHIIPTSGTRDWSSAITFGANDNYNDVPKAAVTTPEAGIYVQSSGHYGTKMYFATSNGSPKMIIDQNGKIGAGTTTPLGRFDISFNNSSTASTFTADRTLSLINVNTTNNSASSLAFRTIDNAGTTVSGAEILGVHRNHATSTFASDIAFITNSVGTASEKMRIRAEGGVGIGTTTPYYSLTVASSTGPQFALTDRAGIGQWTFRNAGGNLYLATTTTTTGYATTSSAAALTIIGSTGTLALGSGTVDTNSLLFNQVITDSMSKTGATFNFYASTTANTNTTTFNTKTETFINSDNAFNFGTFKNSLMTFKHSGTGNVTTGEAAEIKGYNLGSGYITNLYGQVNWVETQGSGNVGNGAGLVISPAASYGSGRFANVYGIYISNQNAGTSTNYSIYSNGGQSYHAGNFGIGTTTPWKALSVNGGVAMSALGNDSTGYYVCLNTTTYALSTSTTACGASSEKYKENIQDITYGLAEVLKLRPVTFDYKQEYIKNGRKQVGFIAEEVATITPEVVAYDDQGQIQGLDYPKFTAVIVKAVQELASNVRDIVAKSLTATVVYTQEIEVDKIKLKGEFCVDDVCLTKDQFKEMMLRSGVGAIQTILQQTPASESSTSTDSNSTSASTTTTTAVATDTSTATDSTATSTNVSTTTIDASEPQE